MQRLSLQPQKPKAVVGIFSLEMSKEQLVNRLLCSQARVDAHRLRTGRLQKEEWKKLAYAVSDLAEAKSSSTTRPASLSSRCEPRLDA